MIKSFRHKALRNYWSKGQTKGIDAHWLPRISRVLRVLDVASKPEDLDLPGYFFHRLSGKEKNRYSLRITANWRLTFAWEDQDATDIDLEDYH